MKMTAPPESRSVRYYIGVFQTSFMGRSLGKWTSIIGEEVRSLAMSTTSQPVLVSSIDIQAKDSKEVSYDSWVAPKTPDVHKNVAEVSARR